MKLSPMSLGGSRVLARLVFGWLVAIFFALHTQAQPTGAGTIVGRVFNPATKEFVLNAEVRLKATDRTTTTANDGSFTFTNVPAGTQTVLVNYTGYDQATAVVQVAPGATATTDVNLTSADMVQLEKFVVSTEREGNAKAIMDQKQSMNVSRIVAAETFGNVAEGNIGEFVKYLPGIQLDYVEADARSPRIRGLPAQYTSVTFMGMKMASADGFIQNNGTDNAAAGAADRSFGFEQVSMSSLDAIEINYTTNASQDADSPAGNINLRPKHAYERNGQRIVVDASLFGNSEQLYFRKTVGPDDHSRYKILPNGNFEYSNSFLNHRLGVIVSLNESNSYNEQRQFSPSYDTTPTPTDPRPIVVTRIQYKDGPKFSERSTASFTLDFKATDRFSVGLIGTLNNYDAFIGNRTFGVSTTRANTVGTDGFTAWNNVPVTGLTSTMSYLNKRTHTYTYLPYFQYKMNNFELSGTAVVSASENNYNGAESKSLPGNSVGGTSLSTTGMTVSAARPANDLYAWNVVQTGGLDWSNLNNYKASATGTPTFSFDGRYNRSLVYQAKLDGKYATDWTIPTWFQVGGKVSETTYIYQNPTAWQTFNYVGPGGGVGGNWALFPSGFVFSQGHGGNFISTTGGTPAVQDHNTIGALFASHPEYFVHPDNSLASTVSSYLTAFTQQPRYVKEQVDAMYAMFDTKPIRRLELQAGVRGERTREEIKDFNPLGSAQVSAAGYPIGTTTTTVGGVPVVTTTGVASTIPGIQYQYFSRPRAARSKSYDNLFPSASAKYNFTANLQALLGYSYTVTRPSYNDIAGVYTENDTTFEISSPNPNLKPQYANNYSAQLSYYFKSVGSFGVGVFENDFKNFVQSQKIPGAAASLGFTDPLYDIYTVTTKVNIDGTVVYRGMTLEYNQTLNFLPHPFNGLTVFVNYTRIYTEITNKNPNLPDSAYNFGWIQGITPNIVNYGVDFKYKRFSVGVHAKWTDTTATTSTVNTWMHLNTKLDANIRYDLDSHWSIYASGRNILDVPDHTFIGKNAQQIGGGRGIEYYGAYFYTGVKATF